MNDVLNLITKLVKRVLVLEDKIKKVEQNAILNIHTEDNLVVAQKANQKILLELNQQDKPYEKVIVENIHRHNNNLIFEFSDGREVIVENSIKDGQDGQNGRDGISIITVELTEEGELEFLFSDRQRINVGQVVATDGKDGRDGISITDVEIFNEQLLVQKSDGTSINLGKVVGTNGENGKDGVGIKEIKLDDTFLKIILTDEKQYTLGPVIPKEQIQETFSKEIKRFEKSNGEKIETSTKSLQNQIDALITRMNQMAAMAGTGGGGFDGGNLEKYIGAKMREVQVSNGVLTLDVIYGNTFRVVLDQNITSIVFRNWPSLTISQRIAVYFVQDSSGGKTVTGYPSNILWPEGTLPDLSTTADAIDCIVFDSFDGGETVFGNLVGTGYQTA